MTAASYSVHPTPIGEALIVLSDEGLACLQIIDGPLAHAVAGASVALGTLLTEDVSACAPIVAQLDEYFDGTRRDFDITLDERELSGFTRRALRAVREIPFGETASYGEVAIAAGAPRAHRAVGTACAKTPWSIVVPAHRVVRADGSLGEYGGHPERKRFLLHLEERVSGSSPVDV